MPPREALEAVDKPGKQAERQPTGENKAGFPATGSPLLSRTVINCTRAGWIRGLCAPPPD